MKFTLLLLLLLSARISDWKHCAQLPAPKISVRVEVRAGGGCSGCSCETSGSRLRTASRESRSRWKEQSDLPQLDPSHRKEVRPAMSLFFCLSEGPEPRRRGSSHYSAARHATRNSKGSGTASFFLKSEDEIQKLSKHETEGRSLLLYNPVSTLGV